MLKKKGAAEKPQKVFFFAPFRVVIGGQEVKTTPATVYWVLSPGTLFHMVVSRVLTIGESVLQAVHTRFDEENMKTKRRVWQSSARITSRRRMASLRVALQRRQSLALFK